MTIIAQRLQNVHKQIQEACQLYGRDKSQVRLLAVSKTHSAAAIQAAIDAGQQAFCENYVQEALAKMQMLKEKTIEWHFIGTIQRNKTRMIAESFHWVHTVASVHVARQLNEQRPTSMSPLNVCVQVNISQEAQKSGVSLGELSPLLQEIVTLPRLKLRGLMAVPKFTQNASAQRMPYRALRMTRDRLQQHVGVALDTLSMGMTADLEAAIAEGATMVRVGTALFGPRVVKT